MAVPLDSSERHGMDGGRGKLRRRRRAPLGCAQEREQRVRGREESEGEDRGATGRLRGVARRPGEEAGGGQGGVGALQRAASCAGAGKKTPVPLVGWLGQLGRQVRKLSLLLLVFCFLFI